MVITGMIYYCYTNLGIYGCLTVFQAIHRLSRNREDLETRAESSLTYLAQLWDDPEDFSGPRHQARKFRRFEDRIG